MAPKHCKGKGKGKPKKAQSPATPPSTPCKGRRKDDQPRSIRKRDVSDKKKKLDVQEDNGVACDEELHAPKELKTEQVASLAEQIVAPKNKEDKGTPCDTPKELKTEQVASLAEKIVAPKNKEESQVVKLDASLSEASSVPDALSPSATPPRQNREAALDELMHPFGCSPVSHAEQIMAAEKTLAMLRKTSAPLSRAQSASRAKEAKADKQAKADKPRKTRAHCVERSNDTTADKEAETKEVAASKGNEAGVAKKRRIKTPERRIQTTCSDASPTHKTTHGVKKDEGMQMSRSMALAWEAIAKVKAKLGEECPSIGSSPQQPWQDSDDEPLIIASSVGPPTFGHSSRRSPCAPKNPCAQLGMSRRSANLPASSENVKGEADQQSQRKAKVRLGFARSVCRSHVLKRSEKASSSTKASQAETSRCERRLAVSTIVQPSPLLADASSMLASLKALRNQLFLRSVALPDIALDCLNVAQVFADAVTVWPTPQFSDAAHCSNAGAEEQEATVLLMKLAMLVAIPPLLELAAENPHADAALRAKELLLQRLEGDAAFATNYVKENAPADVVKDIEELERARTQGVHLGDKLLQFKIRMERDVHVAKVRERVAVLRGREALVLGAKNVAARWAYAELGWRSVGAHTSVLPSPAAAATLGKVQFAAATCGFADPELIRAHFASCELPEEGESQPLAALALQKQCRCLVNRLLAELEFLAANGVDGSKGSGSSSASAPPLHSERSWMLRAAAVTAVAQALAEMALARCRQLQTTLEASHLQLHAARKEAKLKVAAIADGSSVQLLQGGEGKLQELRSLLERVTDERVHGEVLRELKLEEKREAEGQLRTTHEKLMVVEAELKRCTVAAAAWEHFAEVTVSRTRPHGVKTSSETASDDNPKPSVGPIGCLGSNLSDSDWKRLQNGHHLNDALVDLFVGLLANHLGGPRVHAFSSQFFLQLTSRDAEDGVQGWEHVRTWTRGVRKLHANGIFGYDFLILPINVDSVHWMLAVVCHHAESGRDKKPLQDQTSSDDSASPRRAPIIAFLDSLETKQEAQARVLHFLRGYLSCEWKDCVGGDYDCEAISKVSIDVPRQKNSDDCGIFVLEFVAQLLRHPEGFEGLAAPIPSHSLSVVAEPRVRWQRAADALRSKGDAGVTNALAAICDDFPMEVEAPTKKRGCASAEDAEQLNKFLVCLKASKSPATPKSKPKQQARSLQPFGSPRRWKRTISA